MHVYMAMDPETRRVLIQDHEFSDGDFPPGLRGTGWPMREGEVDEGAWAAALAGELTAEGVDRLHQGAWSEAGPEPWPEL